MKACVVSHRLRKFERMSNFTYRKLDSKLNEIRLIILGPRRKRSKEKPEIIRCEIVHVPFSMKAALRPYKAVSYCWGDPEATHRILLARTIHHVSKNLNSFLLRQRDECSTKQYLWIDALCINQADETEKEEQIGLMRSIYSDAAGLLIWLGEADSQSEKAMDVIDNLARYPNIRAYSMPTTDVLALRTLMERPWWDRIWIVQELILGARGDRSDTTLVRYGAKTMTWSRFIAAMQRLDRYNREGRQQFWGVNKALRLEEVRTQSVPECADTTRYQRSLLWWLANTRDRLSSDERDKIYGLLGLVDCSDPNLSLTADYSKSSSELFHNFACHSLKTAPGLELLRHCQEQKLDGLPSWVPDWSVNYKHRPLWNSIDALNVAETPSVDYILEYLEYALVVKEVLATREHYHAAAQTSAEFSFAEEDRNLNVEGVIWDQIATVHEPFIDNVTEPWESATIFMLSVSKCKLIADSLPEAPNPYHSIEGRQVAFWRALLADHGGDGDYRPILRFGSWLSPIPPEWAPRAQHISATDHGTMFKIKQQSMVLRKQFSDFLRKSEPSIPGLSPSDFDPGYDEAFSHYMEDDRNGWLFRLLLAKFPAITPQECRRIFERQLDKMSAKDKEEIEFVLLKKEVLAELWLDGPHDLINSPFSLPSVVPDPYDHERGDPEIKVEVTSTEPELLDSRPPSPTTKIRICPGENAIGFNGDKGCEKYALGRSFFVTQKNYLGLAPPQAEPGDVIAILFGSNVPFVLRRQGNAFKLIGETHVQGIMNGEVIEELENGHVRAEILCII